VGIDDLDRLTEVALDHVSRFHGRAGREILGRRDDTHHVGLRLQASQHLERPEHRGGPGHVELHVLHALRRLDRDAARIEGDPLPHDPHRRRISRSPAAIASPTRRPLATSLASFASDTTATLSTSGFTSSGGRAAFISVKVHAPCEAPSTTTCPRSRAETPFRASAATANASWSAPSARARFAATAAAPRIALRVTSPPFPLPTSSRRSGLAPAGYRRARPSSFPWKS